MSDELEPFALRAPVAPASGPELEQRIAEQLPRPRTAAERQAYIAGFDAALDQVAAHGLDNARSFRQLLDAQ